MNKIFKAISSLAGILFTMYLFGFDLDSVNYYLDKYTGEDNTIILDVATWYNGHLIHLRIGLGILALILIYRYFRRRKIKARLKMGMTMKHAKKSRWQQRLEEMQKHL